MKKRKTLSRKALDPKRQILIAYSNASISRSTAMEHLGLTWYGQLLDGLQSEGLTMPRLSNERTKEMVAVIQQTIGNEAAP